jgi:hypothetical protein
MLSFRIAHSAPMQINTSLLPSSLSNIKQAVSTSFKPIPRVFVQIYRYGILRRSRKPPDPAIVYSRLLSHPARDPNSVRFQRSRTGSAPPQEERIELLDALCGYDCRYVRYLQCTSLFPTFHILLYTPGSAIPSLSAEKLVERGEMEIWATTNGCQRAHGTMS